MCLLGWSEWFLGCSGWPLVCYYTLAKMSQFFVHCYFKSFYCVALWLLECFGWLLGHCFAFSERVQYFVLFCGFYDVLGGSVILLCIWKDILNVLCFYAFTRVLLCICMSFLVGLVCCYTLKNKGASRCHRITFLSKWFHKEPLTSEETFCFTKGSLWRKKVLQIIKR